MKFLVYGRVQGVGFRPTVYRIAKELGCRGYIRNNGSNVEIAVSEHGQKFIDKLMAELPRLAEVTRIEKKKISKTELKKYKSFEILASKNQGVRESYVPADVAVCDECLNEMFEDSNRRNLYPFTNCTNCGARYSVIENVPYDRSRTAMELFKLCDKCNDEYKTPEDRRFHAQTISCPDDGPRFTLHGEDGSVIESEDPIQDFAKMIDSGKIGVMKSWGGMHITSRLEEIGRLRRWYKRPGKPFAVMVSDLEAAKRYGVITDEAEKLLNSPERPIVLVQKNFEGGVSEEVLESISPGLGNVGLYLPYTGIQHIVFSHIQSDALVMTSANPKGMPMIINNDEALKLELDCYLFNNREIINRIDDSLVIPGGGTTYFIRRARGYVPIPFEIPYDNLILALGAERNVTAAISTRKQLYATQYIGNANYYDVLLFLDSAIEQLRKLFNVQSFDAVAVDYHPQYPTTRRGRAMAKELGCELIEIQHHHAHAASLMLESGIEPPFVAITIDGAGYGTDGTIWGGEVLKVLPGGEFVRTARLEQIPLLGGDSAVKDIKRLRFAVVEKAGVHSVQLFPEKMHDLLLKLMDTSIVTSSLGRSLDALSNILGICEQRTYDGEPAMRLERYLSASPKILEKAKMETLRLTGTPSIIETNPLFTEVLLEIGRKEGELSEKDKTILATDFVNSLMREMAADAIEAAESEGLRKIGVSGGVSYNLPLVEILRPHIEGAGMELVTHRRIPNGDGGISLGQNLIASEKLNK
ncbi:MAG: carbamoyltransferase HypF [Thermoplasmata archaeon]|nr:MAG: carbamoyltransferase HypF [Thermoplasmata archaeon]